MNFSGQEAVRSCQFERSRELNLNNFMKKLFAIFFMGFLSSQLVFAQSPCQEIREDTIVLSCNKEIRLFEWEKPSLNELYECLKLDYIDKDILQGATFDIILSGFKKGILTYGMVMDSIEKLRSQDWYPKIKNFRQFIFENENQPIESEGWIRLESMMYALEYEAVKVKRLKRQFYENIDSKVTYGLFFDATLLIQKPKKGLEVYQQMQSLEIMLDKAREEEKPLLLYFNQTELRPRSGEYNFYRTDLFERIEKKYTPFYGLIDDCQIITDKLRRDWNIKDKDIETFGEYYSQLQAELSKNNELPFYAIISLDGEILDTLNYNGHRQLANIYLDFLNIPFLDIDIEWLNYLNQEQK